MSREIVKAPSSEQKSSQTTCQIIGEGGYGCVIHPDIKTLNKSLVSKCSADKNLVEQENQLYKFIIKKASMLNPNAKLSVVEIKDLFSKKIDEVSRTCGLSQNNRCLNKNKQFGDNNGLLHCINMEKLDKSLDYKFSWNNIYYNQILEIAKTINVFHDIGIVHRDIKPENIMRSHQNKFVIIDFGLVYGIKNIFESRSIEIFKFNYPFYPPEYKLYYQFFTTKKYNQITTIVSDFQKNKEYWINIIMNKRKSFLKYLPFYESVETERNLATKAFENWIQIIEKTNLDPKKRIEQIMDDIFGNYQKLVDVYGFGCVLYKLYLYCNKSDEIRLFLLAYAKELTSPNIDERLQSWNEFLQLNPLNLNGGYRIRGKRGGRTRNNTSKYVVKTGAILSNSKGLDIKKQDFPNSIKLKIESGRKLENEIISLLPSSLEASKSKENKYKKYKLSSEDFVINVNNIIDTGE